MVVSVLAALLFAGGGVLGYLWWTAYTELEQTRTDLQAQVDDLAGTVEARDSEIDRLGGDLQQARDQLADAETELEGTENLVQLLEEQQDTIRQCILLASEINETIEGGGTPSQAQLDEADAACDEANQILGF